MSVPAPSRRAMTLIELLVTLALLALMAVLTTVIWGQLRGWNNDTLAASAALRPIRLNMMLQRQWDHRAVAGDDAQTLGRVEGTRTELRFLTHHAVLTPGWPLVRASYTIEPVDTLGPASGARLVYRETRLGPSGLSLDVGAPEEPPLVVLDHCSAAQWRWRVRTVPEPGAAESPALRWAPTPEPERFESTEMLRVEFRAQLRGEEVAWIGVIEPSP